MCEIASCDVYSKFILFVLFQLTYIDSHLPLLMVALKPIVKWFDLSLHLGLSHATLETIEIERRERVVECKREVLVAWLQSATNTTKQDLMNALSKISPST